MIRLLLAFEDVFPGLGAFRFTTFRALCAAIAAFLFCLLLGPAVVRWLRMQRVGENIRTDSDRLNGILHGAGKVGTPTMGGILIVGAILFSTALFARLDGLPVILALWTTVAMGVLGAADDWRKLTVKASKGMSAGRKVAFQSAISLVVVGALYAHAAPGERPGLVGLPVAKSMVLDLGAFYLLAGVFVMVGASNAVNLTDGLDGLAAGCAVLAALALAPVAYAVGRADWSAFLHMPHVPQAGELTVYLGAVGGACAGFLWWNCHPASVFMGNTGSLALGGGLAVAALASRQEWALALAGGVFVFEVLSVVIQVAWFKRTGRRIFRCAPFHHHLQFLGWKETQVVTRLWIVAGFLGLATLFVVKVR
ncbi:MAG: phospho-N-acetylmuramoyl-pentapeptide-transferase [Planctomycetaceae bacterium]|nr:phospho-N-acetylmuramoyl-pentapeptide-transferase [Planctomycetaceae bacterium]